MNPTEGVRGPVHEVDPGRYVAVIRAGVPMIERADSAGAVLAIEFDTRLERARWERAIVADDRKPANSSD